MMSTIKIKDITLYYELHGKGEPIVFITGFGADHLTWAPLVDKFNDRYQLILFDNRGAGQTTAPVGPYSIEEMADDVVTLCSKLGIKKAHFVGSSMGGFILQIIALRQPTLVKSATISNSMSSSHTCFNLYLAAQLELIKAGAPLAAVLKASSSWLFSYQFLSREGVLDELVQRGLDNPYPFTIQGYEGQTAALSGFDSSTWINQINVPTLVLGSDQDLIFSEQAVQSFAKKIPNATYHCFTDCGHLPMIEYPDEYSSLVHAFIGRV